MNFYQTDKTQIHAPSTILFLILVAIFSIILLSSCGKQEPNTPQTQQTEISNSNVYVVIQTGFYKKCIAQVTTLQSNVLYKLKTTSCPESFDNDKEFEVSHSELKTLIN